MIGPSLQVALGVPPVAQVGVSDINSNWFARMSERLQLLESRMAAVTLDEHPAGAGIPAATAVQSGVGGPGPQERVDEDGFARDRPPAREVAMNNDRAQAWKDALVPFKVSNEGDPNFPMAFANIRSLLHTTPPVGRVLRRELALQWMQHAFAGHAQRYLWQLMRLYPAEGVELILGRMESRFFNQVHATTLKMKWEGMRMMERESVSAYAERVADMATCQSVLPTDAEMKNRFLAGLHLQLQDWTLLVGASFAEAVAVTVKTAQKLAYQRKRVSVDEVFAVDGVEEAPWVPGRQRVSQPGLRMTGSTHASLNSGHGAAHVEQAGMYVPDSSRAPRVPSPGRQGAQTRVVVGTTTGSSRCYDRVGKRVGGRPEWRGRLEPPEQSRKEIAGFSLGEPDVCGIEEFEVVDEVKVDYELCSPCPLDGSAVDGARENRVEELNVGERVPEVRIPVSFPTSRGHMTMDAKVDTGAGPTIMDEWLFDELEGQVESLSPAVHAVAPDGRALKTGASGWVWMEAAGAGLLREPVLTMPGLRSQLLLGRDFLKRRKALLDFGKGRVLFVVKSGQLSVPFDRTQEPYIEPVDDVEVDEEAHVVDALEKLDLTGFGERAQAVRAMLKRNREVFIGSGCIHGEEYKIHLKEGATPANIRMRRKSPQEEVLEREEVTKHLKAGNLVPCAASAWGAVNVFVKKKSGAMRMTTDFRALNQRVVKEIYPLKDLKEVLEFLARGRVFSALDLKDGFFNISLEESCRHLTAVKTVLGLVCYAKDPQGLITSPFVMQRAAENLLRPFAGVTVAYMDDMHLVTISVEEHERWLEKVVVHLRERGAKLNVKKCEFGFSEVEVPGHSAKGGEIAPGREHVNGIANLTEPRSAEALLRFLGLCNWFSSHVPGFAEITRPLYDVLAGTRWNAKRRNRFERIVIEDFDARWGESQRNAWLDLKAALLSPAVLVPPVPERAKRLFADASADAIGAVLLQQENGGVWRPIAFISRRLKGPERNYSVSEKELLSILYAARKLRHYVMGAKVEFVTDHQALSWMWRQEAPTGRLSRWLLELQSWDFVMRYRPGEENAAANCLSRDGALDSGECEDEAVDETSIAVSLPSMEELLREQRALETVEMPHWKDDDEFAQDQRGLIVKQVGAKELPWVPSTLVKRVLGYYHGPAFAGHFGRDRLMRRVGSVLWWPHFKKTIDIFLKECVHCTMERMPRLARVKGILAPFRPVRRFELVAVDVTTVTPESERGFKKVLVIADQFTRYVVCMPMRDESAVTVAEALLEGWVYRFGAPERILSDNGAAFAGEVVRAMCSILGIKQVFTSPYHPQGNGQVERFNRTLLSEVRARVLTSEQDWDKHLAAATYAYNTSVHETTRMSPFEAMFGVKAPELDRDILVVSEDAVAAETDIAGQLCRLHELVRKATEQKREPVARWYNS
ncbi:Transposon Ty3-I Gag-Pol polyprotein [Porphyridium purpureum]|uniref:RNA-directed DNA polymerase n=1 Tax=Porphyridium purpureum TaxID=35688 RepID=A0A5J4YWZ5_PORPP|nr:Transposon Ty3-I Gag-Pol polyprotein [Porphyridium purpureum]|eukprot:POR6357..scf227_4